MFYGCIIFERFIPIFLISYRNHRRRENLNITKRVGNAHCYHVTALRHLQKILRRFITNAEGFS